MATLLYHIQPWMPKSIVDVEDQIEKKLAQQMERKILVVHPRLDVFELQVLTRPTPTIYLTTLDVLI